MRGQMVLIKVKKWLMASIRMLRRTLSTRIRANTHGPYKNRRAGASGAPVLKLCRCKRLAVVAGIAALGDAGALAGAATQIIQLGATHDATAHNRDAVEIW